jgi:large subunit ribosomal protein L30
MSGRLAVTLTKSRFGRNPTQTAALKALGLRRIRHSVLLEANAATLGNLRHVIHLVSVVGGRLDTFVTGVFQVRVREGGGAAFVGDPAAGARSVVAAAAEESLAARLENRQ